MQDCPLTLDLVLRRALELGGAVEVVSATPSGIDRRSWRDVAERAIRLRGALESLGVDPGGRVATLAWNGHHHVELFLGAPCAGRVVHAVNVRLSGEEIAELMAHAGDEVLFVDASLTPLVATLRERLPVREIVVMEDGASVDPALDACPRYEDLLASQAPSGEPPPLAEDDAAWICHTSGTTGRPKGVVASHRAALLHSFASLTVDSHAISGRDSVLAVTQMFHANAWGMPYTAALAGAKLVLPGRDTGAEALAALIESERVTVGAAVPTVWVRLLEAFDGKHDLTSLRRVLCGGASAPHSLVQALVSRGIDFFQGWGMTEMLPSGTGVHLESSGPWPERELEQASLSVGRPTPGVELRVVDVDGTVLPWDGLSVGEIQARGPWVIRAYLDPDDDANEARFDEGWLRTGDLGRISPDGTVEIVDRIKDLIKSGGEWIGSLRLEQALVAHPLVSEAAVVGVPDERWGERPVAVVVAAPGPPPGRDELLGFLRERVPGWWLPDVIRFVDEIPKTAVGKYDKRRLRTELLRAVEEPTQ
ncbi:MAG: long-chain-fatty-acid--CoA ligase [Gaiellaceae bacterium]